MGASQVVGPWQVAGGLPGCARVFGDKDALGFQAGDANLYRYVGNDPTDAVDPSGLEKAGVSTKFDTRYGVPKGDLTWNFIAPTDAPKGLKIYTYVDMQWEVKKVKNDPDKPRKGNYRFWFDGAIKSGEVKFNLWPYDGSQLGPTNKRPPWPVFGGKTAAENEALWKAYMKKSVDLTNTGGSLSIRLTYRGYKEAAAEKFYPKFTQERGGPCEVPAPDPKFRGQAWLTFSPNRVRAFFRRSNSWLAEQPKIWAAKPTWERVIELKYTWDQTSKDFGNYTITYPMQNPISGTTPYPGK